MLLLVFIAASAFAQAPPAHRLVDEKGVWVEQFDSTAAGDNRYTENNLLYKEGRRFTYRYFFIDKSGQKKLQKISTKAHYDREKAWKLVPLKEKDSLTNDRLQLIVESDLQGIAAGTPGFNHTPIRYEYFAPAGQLNFLERKSLIENEGNTWMQPPTGRLFRILALNPFPFIKAPYTLGASWKWEQIVPSYWGDARWQEWSSPVKNTIYYKIIREEALITPLGSLNCLVVEASAKSTLGSTSLLSYFHPQYGFIKLTYHNIDGSQLIMELLKVEE